MRSLPELDIWLSPTSNVSIFFLTPCPELYHFCVHKVYIFVRFLSFMYTLYAHTSGQSFGLGALKIQITLDPYYKRNG